MTENEIYAAIKAQFPDDVVAVQEGNAPEAIPLKQGKEIITIERPKPLPAGPVCYGWVEIKPAALPKILKWARDQKSLQLDFPHCVSGVDYKAGEPLGVSYHLTSLAHKHWACFKVFTPRDNPVVPSVVDIFPGVDWHEREAFDMYGIRFEGHPNLRRILCAEDWEGWPLRKDYKFPDSYHGIPTAKEVRWNS